MKFNHLCVLITVASITSGASGLLAAGCSGADDCSTSATCAGATVGPDGSGGGSPKIVLPPAVVTVIQGARTDVPITIERASGLTGDVELTFTGVPAAITIAPVRIAAGATTGTVVIETTASQPQGTVAPIGVTGRAVGTASPIPEASLTLFVRGPSGSVDTTFGGGPITTAFDTDVTHAVAQADGKVVAVAVNPGSKVRLVRLNADGSVDPMFGNAGYATTSIDYRTDDVNVFPRAVVDGQGRILVHGAGISRLTASGQLDTTWGKDGTFAPGEGGKASFIDLALDSGGFARVAESCQSVLCTKNELRLRRLDPSGVVDSSFNVIGAQTIQDGPYASDPGSSQRLVVTADGTTFTAHSLTGAVPRPGVVTALGADGTKTDVKQLGEAGLHFMALGLRPDGGVVVARARIDAVVPTTILSFALVDGKLVPDLTFGGTSGAEGAVGVPTTVRVLASGKVLVAGVRHDRRGFFVQRLNADGTPDVTYGSNGTAATATDETLSSLGAFIQADESVLAVGGLHVDAKATSYIARLWQ